MTDPNSANAPGSVLCSGFDSSSSAQIGFQILIAEQALTILRAEPKQYLQNPCRSSMWQCIPSASEVYSGLEISDIGRYAVRDHAFKRIQRYCDWARGVAVRSPRAASACSRDTAKFGSTSTACAQQHLYERNGPEHLGYLILDVSTGWASGGTCSRVSRVPTTGCT